MTTIEWTDEVWNPTTGCDRISPGCDNCYALTMAKRLKGMGQAKYQTDGDPRTSGPGFGLAVHPDTLTEPLRWKKPRRIFVNSMSDLFHARVPREFLVQVFAVMAATPQHTYQILTKRPDRAARILTDLCRCGAGHPPGEHFRSSMEWAATSHSPTYVPGLEAGIYHRSGWPLPNVWLGTSVEDQKRADLRIPALLETPAAVRFLSCEPLLGPVDLKRAVRTMGSERGHGLTMSFVHAGGCCRKFHGIDWVIVGGESGHRARAMHPDWARSLRDQCEQAEVPFFFKQWGEWGPAPFIVRVCDRDAEWQGTEEELAAAKADSEARGATHVHTGNAYEEDGERKYWLHEMDHKPWSRERVGLFDGAEAIRRWGKKRAGRELDGRTHDDFPKGGSA
ncbi:phage Gp37/Gp68 family protein [Streptomyces chartreusis]|uniref:phage Gp37/Gp68 family protein n=1 Tax=Streptomyces chartreusis TaxID=1969 RepID=UPI00362EFEF3